MKIRNSLLILILLIVFGLGFLLGRQKSKIENFDGSSTCNICNKPKPCGCSQTPSKPAPSCNVCKKSQPCGCPLKHENQTYIEKECAPCPSPDPTKWVLKSSVPPCPPMPDMSRYMLKTECPPIPDMSKYVLKSSIPACPPCISTCSKPCKIGECPPCPRARCPVVKCPDPKACPACPTAMCAPCPEPEIKCKASYEPTNAVRPMLASTSTFGL